MSTTLVAPPPAGRVDHRTRRGTEPVDATRPALSDELRWVRWLGIPFVASAASFAAAIATGSLWLMGVAFGVGPELMILGYVFLSLASDSNVELSVVGRERIRETPDGAPAPLREALTTH
jgi:hypothetical protein